MVRCDAGGAVTELRLGAAEIAENLAFVAVEARAGGEQLARSASDWCAKPDEWRLISVGLLMLDLPAMSHEWAEADVRASEVAAVAALHKIADALDIYRRAFDRLPESLEQLGPAPKEGLSPDRAALAGRGPGRGRKRRLPLPLRHRALGRRHRRAPSAISWPDSLWPPLPCNTASRRGRRSFYLDSAGTLRGADKQGEVATPERSRD